MSFEIIGELQAMLDDYHVKSMLMEKHTIKKEPFKGNLNKAIDDDLIRHVPIYDMGSRRFAAFCSFTEAVWYQHDDYKGNGKFLINEIKEPYDWFMLFYLFRLCGSGINYIPKSGLFNDFYGTHGFGNFWIIDSILMGRFRAPEWLDDLKQRKVPFTDNKGYLLPQFSYPGLKSGHLKHFILHDSWKLVAVILDYLMQKPERAEIYQVTDIGNKWLNDQGYKKQNFVLSNSLMNLVDNWPQEPTMRSRLRISFLTASSDPVVSRTSEQYPSQISLRTVSSITGFPVDVSDSGVQPQCVCKIHAI